jgi:hypothetical protein
MRKFINLVINEIKINNNLLNIDLCFLKNISLKKDFSEKRKEK